ncbi:MAG: monovalent cation:proton antiporter-2 (CPA2) family protein [Acidiferrobacterales bacterium]
MQTSLLYEAVLFLAAAIITVPLSRKLGVGAVLGYLGAGVLIGPWAFRLIGNVGNIFRFSQLGVVLLLFIIGLELQPSRLWVLRKAVFGQGAAQVAVTALIIAVCGLFAGLRPVSAILVGLVLSFSSTAFVLQILAEKHQLTTKHGRSAFALLLFQDLAAIPLLALIPLLAPSADIPGQQAGLVAIAKAASVVILIIFAGRLLLRPFFRLAASTGLQEIFTAAALLLVMGSALLMDRIGLSMGLGAFIAGVLVADSEYRHELEADIEPFKGLLLGLFFIAVGMSVNLALIAQRPFAVLGAALGLMLIKAAVLYVLGRIQGQNHPTALNLALFLSQGGEFAFVLFGAAAAAKVLDKSLVDFLVVVVSLSMAFTPILVMLGEYLLRMAPARGEESEYDSILDQNNPVIIAGFGRFGQMIARTLRMKKIPFTALEASFEQVNFVRKFGNKIYFGDASRLDLLRSARADSARAFVLAIDDVDASVRTAETVKRHYPDLKIYARARNRQHAYRLMDIGVDYIVRETFLSSLELAREVLQGLGLSSAAADSAVQRFRQHDEELLLRQHKIHHDEAQLIASVKQGAEELERLFEEDTKAVR